MCLEVSFSPTARSNTPTRRHRSSDGDAILTKYKTMWCAEVATRPRLIRDCRGRPSGAVSSWQTKKDADDSLNTETRLLADWDQPSSRRTQTGRRTCHLRDLVVGLTRL